MNGTICHIGTNNIGLKYGIINTDDGQTYYFDSRSLNEFSFSDLSKGDPVVFDEYESANGNKIARNVRIEYKEGVITFYNVIKGYGFIDNRIYFQSASVKNLNEYNMNTFNKQYRARYTEHDDYRQEGKKIAKNILILSEESIVRTVDPQATDAENSHMQINNLQPVKTQKLSQKTLDEFYALFEANYNDGDEISLADLGNLLRLNSISYKEYGFQKLRQFCEQLSEFLDIEDRIVGSGTQSYAIFKAKNSSKDSCDDSREENGSSQSKSSLRNGYIAIQQNIEELTDEVRFSIYVFLLNKFKAEMQWPMPAVIRELAYAGYRGAKYGFRDARTFLQQFPRFISLEDVVTNGGNSVYVTIHRVPEWEISNNDEEFKVSGGTFENKTWPGINANAKLEHFSADELKITKAFADVFYVSNGGGYIKVGDNSRYDYCLLKPTALFSEQFNLFREIIMVFSDYATFEPRSLDAIGKITELVSSSSPLRLERICSIMVSRDPQVSQKMKDLLKTNSEEMQTIIPFSYQEVLDLISRLSPSEWREFVIQRFREYFYERDLFSFRGPLKKDLYFFGRQSYVQELVNSHLAHENSGVFGLRRSGKTSILYAVQRTLDKLNKKWIWIDGQTLQHMRWNHALHYLVSITYEKFGIEFERSKEEYSPENAAVAFEADMQAFVRHTEGESLLILFDEIEHITFDIALSSHWRSGEDFIYFWSAIRAYYQKHQEHMTFIIAGTNPKAIEVPLINGYPNPLYQQLTTEKFLPLFTVLETTDMVNKLGGYMGLKFDDVVCSLLTQDFGGQPFLIRQFCSAVNAFVVEHNYSKPRIISKTLYDQVKALFDESDLLSSYCDLILDVLKNNYPDEFMMLESIALNDEEVLSEQAENSAITSHLIGYGLIERDGDFFGFKNESVHRYLLNKNRFKRKLRTNDEKWSEINERRNKVEIKLRKIVKLQLKSHFGESQAHQLRVNGVEPQWQAEYRTMSYNDLFDPKKCNIFWRHLINLVYYNWKAFENLFSDRKLFKAYGDIINDMRRDCHAEDISDDEMNSFRGAIAWFEKEIADLE